MAGFDSVKPTAPPSGDDDSGVMGMLARRRKELMDALQAGREGTGGAPAPNPNAGDYQDLLGKWHRKGERD